MPPRITKQTPNGPSAQTDAKTGVFSRVKPVALADEGGIHISIYGVPKSGKTRLLSTFPKPLLLVGSEDGTRSIRGIKGIDFVLIKHSSEALELFDGCVQRGYASVALDTLTRLYDMVMAELMGLAEIPKQRNWGEATKAQYGQCGIQLKTILGRAMELPINVAVTAHEKDFGGDGDSDMIAPFISSAVMQSVERWLNGEVDYIGQTFKRAVTVTRKTTLNGQTKETKHKTDKVEYCLRVGPHATYNTGFRHPPGGVLPDVIVDPSYEKIRAIVEGRGAEV